jgi:hypothetical protein
MAQQNTLATIQAKVKAPKGQFNSFGKYKYRSAEDILESVKLIINPLGFSIVLSDTIINVGDRFYIKATATLTDGKETYSADGYAREDESKKGMDGSQVTGASSSYARKYALNGLFALDDTKDADATNTHGKEVQAYQPKQEVATEPSVLSAWQVAVKKCNTGTELMALYSSNKELIDSDINIKSLFTTRKLEID